MLYSYPFAGWAEFVHVRYRVGMECFGMLPGPVVGELDSRMLPTVTSTRNGSITSIQAVYVPSDDMTDPAPATTFIHLDATTVLARSLAAKGIDKDAFMLFIWVS